jgi:hypothetical protein
MYIPFPKKRERRYEAVRFSNPENQLATIFPLILGVKLMTLSASSSRSPLLLPRSPSLPRLSILLPGVRSVGLGISAPSIKFCVLDFCTLGNVMPRGRAGGVPGLALSWERKLRLDFGVPPLERECFGARIEG